MDSLKIKAEYENLTKEELEEHAKLLGEALNELLKSKGVDIFNEWKASNVDAEIVVIYNFNTRLTLKASQINISEEED